MDLSASLIDGVAKLAQLGGIGVGMAVFLFAFFPRGRASRSIPRSRRTGCAR